MAAKVSLPSINEMFPEHMLGPWYADRDRPTHDQTHDPQQALRSLEPPYAPQPPLSPEQSSYDVTASRPPDPSPSRARPSFRVQIPPTAPYEHSQYTPSSSYAPSSATSVYPPSSVYTPSSSSSTLPSYAPSPATFRTAPLPPSPYMLQPPDAFPPQTQPYPAQAFANPLQQPYGATPYGMGAAPGPAAAASEEKKHSCPHCHKRFNRPSSLSIHVNTHTGAKPFRCPFPGCSRAFNVNSNMRRHWRNHVSAARRAGGPVPAAPAPEPAQGPSSRPAAPTALPPPPAARPAEAYPHGRAVEYTYAEYGAPRAHYAAPPPPQPPQHQQPYAEAPRYPRQDRPPTPPLSHSASSSPQSSSGHSLPPVAPPPPAAYAAGKAHAAYAPYRARLAGPAHAPEEPFGRDEEDELASGDDEREGDEEDDEAYTPPPSPPPPVQHPPEGVYGRARSRSSPRLAPTRYTPYATAAAPPRREAWGARPEGRARSSTVAGAVAGVGGRWG